MLRAGPGVRAGEEAAAAQPAGQAIRRGDPAVAQLGRHRAARVQLDQALRPRHHARRVHQGRADVALRSGIRRPSLPVGRSGRRAPRARRGPRGGDDLPERGGHERDRRAADRVRRRRRALFRRGRARLSGRTGSPRSRRAKPTRRTSRCPAGRSRNSSPGCTGSRPTSRRTRARSAPALVTARSAPAHERVIRTLRAWNIRIDEALFLGGLDKGEFLRAFRADIFFDDQRTHVESAAEARRRRPRAARRRQRREAADPVSAPAIRSRSPTGATRSRSTMRRCARCAGSDAPPRRTQFRAARERSDARASGQPDHARAPRLATGLAGIRYDPAWRVRGAIDSAGAARDVRDLARVRRRCCAARASAYARFCDRRAHASALAMYWFEGYGGGLWLPFSDASERQPKPTAAAAISTTRSRAPTSALPGADDRARLQLRLQPVVRVRRPLVVSAVAAGESAAVRGRRPASGFLSPEATHGRVTKRPRPLWLATRRQCSGAVPQSTIRPKNGYCGSL